jgi:ureidoacrylate peracid hydrolase
MNQNTATRQSHPSTRSARVIKINARPAPIRIDLDRTAVMVIDMQNDFGAPGGMFDRAGVDISTIQAAVAPTVRVLAAARQASIPVVYLKMGFLPDLSDAGAANSPNFLKHRALHIGKKVVAPDGSEGRILIRETWNTEILPALKPAIDDTVIYKHRYSGFYATKLDAVLKRLGAEYLLITGCTTSICVDSTIRDAMFRDYSCVLLSDCTGEPLGQEFPRSNQDASIFVIQALIGWVTDSNTLMQAMS